MRNITFSKNEYYLIKNSGSFGSNIFVDENDKIRFIFLILYLQSPTIINNVDWYVGSFIKKGKFTINPKTLNIIFKERQLELLSFLITPTEFTLIVHNLEEHIVSVYMQRILTGYSRYFNSKYKRKGHVFQGPFYAQRIKKVEVEKEINKLHKEIDQKEETYSSRLDYITNNKNNRWDSLLRIYKKK